MSKISEFLAAIPEPKRSEIQQLHDFIVETVPALEQFHLGKFMAYGPFHYKYESGREGDWFIVGIGNNKNAIALYICSTKQTEYIPDNYKDELGKADVGKGCIRFKKFEDLNKPILKNMLLEAAATLKN